MLHPPPQKTSFLPELGVGHRAVSKPVPEGKLPRRNRPRTQCTETWLFGAEVIEEAQQPIELDCRNGVSGALQNRKGNVHQQQLGEAI